MAALAGILFALTWGDGETRPFVKWYFSLNGCGGCHAQQHRLMDTYFQPGDLVVIRVPDQEDQRSEPFEKLIRARYEVVEVAHEAIQVGCPMVIGFEYHDPLTGEVLGYNGTGGTYNPVRAGALLALFRDPRR